MEKVIKVKKINKIKQNNNSKTIITPYGIEFTANPQTFIELELCNTLTKEAEKELQKAENIKIVYTPKKEILDEVEKKYLREVIRPFRDRVGYIEKQRLNQFYCDDCYIEISIDDDDSITLPNFDISDMYLGMELNREYSLEELGL